MPRFVPPPGRAQSQVAPVSNAWSSAHDGKAGSKTEGKAGCKAGGKNAGGCGRACGGAPGTHSLGTHSLGTHKGNSGGKAEAKTGGKSAGGRGGGCGGGYGDVGGISSALDSGKSGGRAPAADESVPESEERAHPVTSNAILPTKAKASPSAPPSMHPPGSTAPPSVHPPASKEPQISLPTRPPPWLKNGEALLRLLGRGGGEIDVNLPYSTQTPIDTWCPHGCDIELVCTGMADKKLGVDVRHVDGKGGLSAPVDFAVPVHKAHKDWGQAGGICPGCRGHLCIELRCPRDEIVNKKSEHAYVSTLALSDQCTRTDAMRYITQALTLADSLERKCRVKRRVLLVTAGVLEWPGAHLLNLFWEVRVKAAVQVSGARRTEYEDRSRGAFTKLNAWDLTEFDKIIFLDVEVLVTRCIDDLFGFETPAAVPQGNFEGFEEGVSASVLVLRPLASEFRKMVNILKEPTGAPTTVEEFLGKWFYSCWLQLPARYNVQMHELQREMLKIDDVMIVHFSGGFGPYDFLFEEDASGPGVHNFDDYFKMILLPLYPVREHHKQLVRELCSTWIAAFRLMWKELVARVHQQKPIGAENFMECPACGQLEEDRGLTFEHTFSECTETAECREEFHAYVRQCQPQLLRLGVRDSMTNEKVFPGALHYVDQVFRKRLPDAQGISGVGRVGEKPVQRAVGESHPVRPVMMITAIGSKPSNDEDRKRPGKGKGKGKGHGKHRGRLALQRDPPTAKRKRIEGNARNPPQRKRRAIGAIGAIGS